ncbi:hypothetical protein ACJIZ3_020721 [Penstemon smallii]|uniref:RING-type E3 ubiquitin transferase n=1 Tax=Penstemon smallii TaxID=265156 RepID=A0ABD3SK76_9LAMI
MNWVLLEIKERSFLSPSQQPYFLSPPPPPSLSSSQSNGFNLNNKVSPNILLIIIILAIIFFISGLLHLLVRFLLRPPNRDPDEIDSVTALQGQLQQLFHLHDSGVDQSFIDTLPVFNYKAIIGVKDPFDCAVCLCEFEGEDKLRLLPQCSHAFHMECIDTWLLSHSTCPLCRASLILDYSQNRNFSPLVHVLESGSSESSREIVNISERENSHLGVIHFDDDFRQKSGEIVQEKEDENQGKFEKVVSVKLGKFRNVDNNGGSEGNCSESNDASTRRCFSMGSFAYVMDEKSSLQVPIRNTPMKKQLSKKPNLPLTPGHRLAMSECGCDSRREFNGFESFKVLDNSSIGHGNDSKRESFSVSKIWLRGKKDRPNAAIVEESRRAYSFRFPVHRDAEGTGEPKRKNGGVGARRALSEIDMSRWENGGSEVGFGEDIQSFNSLDSESNPPSLARRTLLWIMGRQNKVVHSTFSSNV